MSVRITPLIRTPLAVYAAFPSDTLTQTQPLVRASASGDPARESDHSIPQPQLCAQANRGETCREIRQSFFAEAAARSGKNNAPAAWIHGAPLSPERYSVR